MVNPLDHHTKPKHVMEFEAYFLTQMLSDDLHEAEEDIIEGFTQNEKLESERVAWLERVNKAKHDAKMAATIHQRIEEELVSKLANKVTHLKDKGSELPITQSEINLFQVLLNPNADTHAVGECIRNIAWMQNELLQIFHRYGYLQDAAVEVKDPMLIIHYMGLENMRLWIGYLCNRRWLPLKSFRLHRAVKRTLAYQTSHALAVRRLARLHNIPVDTLYLATVLHNSGASTLLWIAAQTAEQCWSRWLRDAERIREASLYETILLTKYPIHIISNVWYSHYNEINNYIFKHLQWKPCKTIDLVKELNTGKSFAELSDIAKMVKKGSCYAKFHLLDLWKYPHQHIKEKIFEYYKFTQKELEAMKEINFRKLPLT